MFFNKLCLSVLFLLNISFKNLALEGGINAEMDLQIRASINSSVQPCEDFYSFACGSYKRQNAANPFNDIISQVDSHYNSEILNLLENSKDYKLPQNPMFVEKVKAYYRSCCYESKRNLTKYFEELKPGLQTNWPILQELLKGTNETPEAIKDTDFDIWSLLGKLQSHGLNNLMIYQEILVGKDGELSIMLTPFQDVTENTLPDVKVLHVLLLNMGVKNPAKIIQGTKKINKNLVNILKNSLRDTQPKSQQMTYGDLEIFYPNLNLNLFLQELLPAELTTDTFILLKNPAFFQNLNDYMNLILEKPHLVNYLMLKFLYFLAFDGPSEFKKMACIKDVRNKFDLAVNYLYHHHIFSLRAKKEKPDIEQIFQAELDIFAKYLNSNYLHLSSSQVQLLTEKLNNVRLNIGNLPDNKSVSNIEEFYSKVPTLSENNYYKNHLIMLQHRFAKSLYNAQSQTYFIVSDNKLGSTSGAFYVPQQNMIVLPFASLMKPLYNSEYNELAKYSLLGFILAHELAHAFDTNGLNFDSKGQFSSNLATVLRNTNFQNSLKCLQNQLPTESIDEIIADIVAVQIVKKILNSKLYQPQTNTSSTNWRRDFFLHIAQIFCNKKNIKYVDHDADSDRLNQIAMNFEGFSNSFECPKESKMSPKEKCRLF